MFYRGLRIFIATFLVLGIVIFVSLTRYFTVKNQNNNTNSTSDTTAAAATAVAAHVPAVFSSLSYADGKAKSTENGQLLIIDFTAVWCGPCKNMDKTTWLDENVTKWISENAIAIQVDIDENKAVAREFGIAAVPVTVILRDGVEVKRHLGELNGAEMLAWLQDL